MEPVEDTAGMPTHSLVEAAEAELVDLVQMVEAARGALDKKT